jgi:hypothetical protein
MAKSLWQPSSLSRVRWWVSIFFWTQTAERTLEFKGLVRQVNLGRDGAQYLQVKEALRTCQRIFTN